MCFGPQAMYSPLQDVRLGLGSLENTTTEAAASTAKRVKGSSSVVDFLFTRFERNMMLLLVILPFIYLSAVRWRMMFCLIGITYIKKQRTTVWLRSHHMKNIYL
jgi:hypothetical protein